MINKVTIYPLTAYNGFGCYYGERKEHYTEWQKIREVTQEELERIRHWTRTEVAKILEEKYFIDPETEEAFKVHFEISKREDILKNNR